jgi:hypothetical protein
MKITMAVCDLCDDQVPATQGFDITRGRASRHVDLCETHARVVSDVYDKGHIPAVREHRAGLPRRTGNLPVTQMEDIESGK